MISFFRIVGERDVPPEQIGTKLGEIAAKHRALMDRWSVLDTADPATAALAAQAKAAIDAGRYDEADAALVRARDQEIAAARQAEQLAQDAQQAAERRWLRVAEADGKLGDLAMTRLRYNDAAKHYAAAASSVPAARQDERRHYLEQEALALYTQGDERGNNEAAALAIDRYRALAGTTDRAVLPLDWGRTQVDLGNALQTLGRARGGNGAAGGGGRRLSCRPGGTDPRAGAARLGADAEQPRQRARDTRGARERHGASGGGGRRLSCRPGGTDPRAGAARLGHDAEQPRRRAQDTRGARERHGAAGGGGRRLSCRRWRNGPARGCRSTGP